MARGIADNKWIGRAMPRTEDRRLLTGAARYVADLALPDLLEMHVLRSPHAHARLRRIDASGLGTSVPAFLTASLMDYLIPTAYEVPGVRTAHLHTPSPHTPGGFKGVGEAGTIPVPAAIANAVMDAVRPEGAAANTLPLTPERVLALVQRSPFARHAVV